jgi:hypothetical protein
MSFDDRTLPVPRRPERLYARPAAAPEILRLTAPFAAQLLGQAAAGRDAEAGVEVPGEARTAYLRREYSGEEERRLPPGVFRRTKA